MSKDVNKQTAEKLFASTTHDVLWANPKGEFFTSENIGSLSLKAGQKLTKFERSEKSEKEVTDVKVAEVNIKDTIAKIKAVDSLEALKAFESDDRKSVKQVYDWKLKQLTEAITVVGAKNVANGNEDTDTKK
ncbi:MAG: hypothetical protein KA980_11435 [Flavobacterium sp.]|nr:hypothetical protein [Flavobacterium sp.]MBP7318812.1 hypothetical protein [Flavobacterium sp.]